ncbi:IniB N-terminal domain-containing protein [Geodermatophilus sp. SYSU D00697]
MSTLASSLLDFILDLFRDPAKAAAYEEDPEAALDAAGLTDVSPDDVADLMPMVADYSTVGGWNGGNGDSCDGDGGARPAGVQSRSDDEDVREHSGGSAHLPARDQDDDEDDDDTQGGSGHGHAPAGGHETVVITHLQEIQYENHETHVSIDASHSIWVSGDAQAIFGDDNVFVGGDGVAAGGDVDGDVTQIDNEGGIVAGDDVEDVTIDNSDNSVNDSYNDSYDVSGDGNAVGRDNDVDTEIDTDIDVENSGNTQNGDGNVAGNGNDTDNSTDVEVDVEDSFNEDNSDNSVNDSGNDNSDNSVNDSGNDNSTTTTTEVEVEDSFNDNSTDVDVDVEDSFQDNSDDDGVDDSLNGNELTQDNSQYTDNSEYTEVEVDVEDSLNDNFSDNFSGNEVEDVTAG